MIREGDDGCGGAIAHGLQCGRTAAVGEAGGGCGSDAAAAVTGGGARRDEPQGRGRDRSYGPADAASPLLPFKFVMGTTNREALAGIRGAIEYTEWLGVEFGRAEVEATRRDRIIRGIEVMRAHEEILMRRLIDGLSRIKGLCVLGPGSSECH